MKRNDSYNNNTIIHMINEKNYFSPNKKLSNYVNAYLKEQAVIPTNKIKGTILFGHNMISNQKLMKADITWNGKTKIKK